MLFWEHEPVYSNAIVGFAILFYLSTFFSCSLYDKVFLEEKTDHYPIGALIEIWVFMKKKYACQKLELHTQSKKIKLSSLPVLWKKGWRYTLKMYCRNASSWSMLRCQHLQPEREMWQKTHCHSFVATLW